jgi:hypothetical protein
MEAKGGGQPAFIKHNRQLQLSGTMFFWSIEEEDIAVDALFDRNLY